MKENNVIWKDNDHLGVWMYLLLGATHKDIDMIFRGEKLTIRAGQLITGRKSIAKELNIHESKVQRILSFFEKNEIIEQLRGNSNRLITILKWTEYQNSEQLMNNCRTTDEHKQEVKNNYNNSYEYIERNFGRTLNSIELEIINSWENSELVRFAVEEACVNNVKKIRYVDKIIYNLKQEGITTYEEARQKNGYDKPKVDKTELFDYDWLNDKTGGEND